MVSPATPDPNQAPGADGAGEENASLERITGQLIDLCRSMQSMEISDGPVLDAVAADNRVSARNLLHYVALRQHDIRKLQDQLASQGLSSLGRCESSVMDSVQKVLEILRSRSRP